MHNGKYQCHMAASCTYHLPTIFSQLLNKSHTKNQKKWKFSGKKSGEWTVSRKMTRQKEQEDWAEKTREEIGKGIKWQPWDSRQEQQDIRHPWPPFGGYRNWCLRSLTTLVILCLTKFIICLWTVSPDASQCLSTHCLSSLQECCSGVKEL